MSTALVSPHHARASHRDLMALARIWEWERVVTADLPGVIARSAVESLFQPIYRIENGATVARGFEALTRFPSAPRVPVGMWFLTARERGLSQDLEGVSIEKALETSGLLHDDAFICVSATRGSLPRLLRSVPGPLRGRLIVQLPHAALAGAGGKWLMERLRHEGVGVALDDLIPETLAALRPFITELRPDCVKVDMPDAIDDPAGTGLLAAAAAWCREIGVAVIVARVERDDDVEFLESIGVDWAQGHALSPPIEV